MATKKPAPATPFTINPGTLLLTFPPGYAPDPRLGTLLEAAYNELTKGRDAAKTAAALRQVADVVEAEPALFTLPEGVTVARLRELADKLDAVVRAKADLDAAAIELSRLTQLDRDAAANVANDTLASLKVASRRRPELAARFNLLFDLNKRG